MPVYNGSHTIVDSIESVLNQTYKDIKLYVIDDCSTDDTAKLLTVNYANNKNVKIIISSKNKGVAASRNLGIKESKGKYIAFCDADDLWENNKIEKQINLLEHNNINVVCSNYYIMDFNKKIIGETHSPVTISYKKMLMKNYVGNLTGVYNAEKLGKFYQKKVGHEDYLMWLEIIKKSNFAICLQENLAFYRVSNNSLSANKLVAAKWTWNIYRECLGLSLPKSLYYFSLYAANGVIKKIGLINSHNSKAKE